METVHSLADSFTDSHHFLLPCPHLCLSSHRRLAGTSHLVEIRVVGTEETADLLLPAVGGVPLQGHQPRDPAAQGSAGCQRRHGAQATATSSAWVGQGAGEGEVGLGIKSVRAARGMW